MKYYSAIKRGIWLFVTRWLNLEDITLSDISQTKEDNLSLDFTQMWNQNKQKPQAHRYREQMSKSRRCNVQHGDYS